MKKTLISLMMATMLVSTSGCFSRIETGEVGIRVNASKQIEGTELLPGSWNQTMVGSIIEFPVRDIIINIVDKKYQTADNSALDDFDVTFVYSINPNQVAELYSTKSKAFHAQSSEGVFLMYNYIETVVNNAAYKAVREYPSLTIGDKRNEIEQEIMKSVNAKLQADNLGTSITPVSVSVKSILPNQQILRSATELVKSQNDLKIKTTEVEIAKKESERMAALSANSNQSIAYMNAQANMKIAEGIAAGKVNTIVVPVDFKGIVTVK